jgi:hypothetical protein
MMTRLCADEHANDATKQSRISTLPLATSPIVHSLRARLLGRRFVAPGAPTAVAALRTREACSRCRAALAARWQHAGTLTRSRRAVWQRQRLLRG